MAHSLDNPVWEALSTIDSRYNSGTETLKFFPENMSPFVALENWDESDLHTLVSDLPENRSFSIMKVNQPTLPAQFQVIFSLPLFQLVCTELKSFTNPSHPIQNLESKDIPQMLELTAKTKPGPFYEKTIDFSNYLGIYSGDTLIAMAGERLHLSNYTEVSAICTHPDYLGKGYASSLTSKVSQTIIANGATPFLHVRQDNTRAIGMYKRLGFEIRSEVYFAVIKKSLTS
jgi:predicted GNAT family acetyltransferase